MLQRVRQPSLWWRICNFRVRNKPVVGCAYVAEDGCILGERLPCPLNEWLYVSGHGVGISITGSYGRGPKSCTTGYFECKGLKGFNLAFRGVQHFSFVRRVVACSERITPELRADLAGFATDMSVEQRMELARRSNAQGLVWAARFAPDLTSSQRLELAMESTAEWRGNAACWIEEMVPSDRMALAFASTPNWRGYVAYHTYGLSTEDRIRLLKKSTPGWRKRFILDWKLTAQQVRELMDNEK